jgi:lysophospholipase L1-like esterase
MSKELTRWEPPLHPVRWVPPRVRLRAALIFLGLTVLLLIAFSTVANLTTPQAPKGMVSLQLAGTLEHARTILDSWDAYGLGGRSGFNLGLDYLFILGYTGFGALGAGGLADYFAGKDGPQGVVRPACIALVGVAWLVILAGLFDVIEDGFLLRVINGGLTAENVHAATFSARIKWSLAAVAAALFVLALVVAFIGTSKRWGAWLAVLVAFVVGAGAGVTWAPFGQEQRAVQPAPPIALSGPGRYVALGDSYAAGEGISPWEPGTESVPVGDRCHRSVDRSYSRLLEFVVQPDKEVFRACSGAVVANVYDAVQIHDGRPDYQGLQVEPDILDADVRLITVTMGGNDLDFASVLRFCAFRSHCQDHVYQDGLTLDRWIPVHLEQLGADLTTLFQRLHQDAPNARIVALGYPALFPDKRPPLLSPHNEACKLLLGRWDGTERAAIRYWGQQLNAKIQNAAFDSKVDYVDVFPFFVGHEPCGSNGDWIRFLGVTTDAPVRDGSFHPTPQGQEEMARIVSCYLWVYPDYLAGSSGGDLAHRFAMNGCVDEGVPIEPSPAPTGSASPSP